jgi:hypothetical protein
METFEFKTEDEASGFVGGCDCPEKCMATWQTSAFILTQSDTPGVSYITRMPASHAPPTVKLILNKLTYQKHDDAAYTCDDGFMNVEGVLVHINGVRECRCGSIVHATELGKCMGYFDIIKYESGHGPKIAVGCEDGVACIYLDGFRGAPVVLACEKYDVSDVKILDKIHSVVAKARTETLPEIVIPKCAQVIKGEYGVVWTALSCDFAMMDGRVICKHAPPDRHGIVNAHLISPPFMYTFDDWLAWRDGAYIVPYSDKLVAWGACKPTFPDADVVVDNESDVPKKTGIADIVTALPLELCDIIEQFVPAEGVHASVARVVACPHMRFHPRSQDYDRWPFGMQHVYVKKGYEGTVWCVGRWFFKGLRPCDMDELVVHMKDVPMSHKLKLKDRGRFAMHDGLILEQGEIYYAVAARAMRLGSADEIKYVGLRALRSAAIFYRHIIGKGHNKFNRATKHLYVVDHAIGMWGRLEIPLDVVPIVTE